LDGIERFATGILSSNGKRAIFVIRAVEDFSAGTVTPSFLACLERTGALFAGLDVLEVLRVFLDGTEGSPLGLRAVLRRGLLTAFQAVVVGSLLASVLPHFRPIWSEPRLNLTLSKRMI